MIQAPIFHVNAGTPERGWLAELCVDSGRRFTRRRAGPDCYRKHGHNEGDKPGVHAAGHVRKIKIGPASCRYEEPWSFTAT